MRPAESSSASTAPAVKKPADLAHVAARSRPRVTSALDETCVLIGGIHVQAVVEALGDDELARHLRPELRGQRDTTLGVQRVLVVAEEHRCLPSPLLSMSAPPVIGLLPPLDA